MDTYANVVEFAQKVEECEIKWKVFESSQMIGPKNWKSNKEELVQGQVRTPQKCPGKVIASALSKSETALNSCWYCEKSGHTESTCRKKAGNYFHCESSKHRVRDSPIYQSKVTKTIVGTPVLREKPGVSGKAKSAHESIRVGPEWGRKRNWYCERYASYLWENCILLGQNSFQKKIKMNYK